MTFEEACDGIEFSGYTALTVEQARAIMDAATYRITEHQPDSVFVTEPYTEVEIHHDGRWLELCRTDLKDNVATGRYAHKTLAEWLKYYKARIRYGARFDGRIFAVIDQFSDG